MRCVNCFLIATIININFNFIHNIEEDQVYWKNLGETELNAALNKKTIPNAAKNIILFIGDGMGPTTVTASRIYGKTEKGHFAFEKFHHIGLLKTYSANKLVPDSCSTATALFSGVKANQKTSGVDATVNLDDCTASLKPEAQLESIMTWAQKAKKSTGFVTTTRVTHATPSALYAHTPNRNWECEDIIPETASKCQDIAKQLIYNTPGKNLEVIMGGGRQCLQSNVTGSEADPIDTYSCYSKDGRDLIDSWKFDKKGLGESYQVVNNNEELEGLDVTNKFVLGIFANGHLKMEHERDKGPKGMPSLTNMTQKAIEVLKKNKNGFVLVVEGGLIDFGHHRGHAKKALDETVAFNDAIEKALEMTDEKETLTIVTADHAHSLVFGGYPDRNTDIIESLQQSKVDDQMYTPLLYGTGDISNYKYYIRDNKVVRIDPSTENRGSFEYSQQAAVLNDEVTHSGTDVVVYANGPMAHLFTSVHEQTFVAYVISYAAKIGPFGNKLTNSQTKMTSSINYIIITCILVLMTSFNLFK